MDFTDPANPVEIAYFDRGPIDAKVLAMGGYWSAYWYNGHVFASEMARGLDVFKLTPTQYLTQNEIDAANTVRMPSLNVQMQERFDWPRKLVVAKAYIDQLERTKSLPAGEIASLRQAIQKSEGNGKEFGNLKKHASSVEKSAAAAKNSTDAARLRSLAEILKQPVA
jgi:hypothetical protein